MMPVMVSCSHKYNAMSTHNCTDTVKQIYIACGDVNIKIIEILEMLTCMCKWESRGQESWVHWALPKNLVVIYETVRKYLQEIFADIVSLLVFICVSWTITGQPGNSVFIHRVLVEICRHSVLSGDRIWQCGTSSGSRHKDHFLLQWNSGIIFLKN